MKKTKKSIWKVTQQQKGKIRPTIPTNSTLVNDSTKLEKEADLLGKKALNLKIKPNK